MDLDALGLNSTFESSELQASYEPPVDRVDTSEIEGPEDFTMNMTYWMTADLPLAQIKSRKEAKGRLQETRMDAMQEEGAAQDISEEGDRAVAVGTPRIRQGDNSNSASPTRRAHGTTDERAYSTPASDRSMENDEKVRSFLSNLPDTEMESAIAGTPLHIPRQSFLQIPRSSPPKARSLQPTVEDYDTPRKPTQETVIHHTSAVNETREHDALRVQIAELQSRLGQQELASKTRITELETILSYTRSELESARTDGYKQKEKATGLEEIMDQQRRDAEILRLSAEAKLKAKEEALDSKIHEYGEEMRLQNLAKLQNQQGDFERQLQALKESKRIVEEEASSRGQALEQVQTELNELQRLHEQRLQEMTRKQEREHDADSQVDKDHVELSQQLSHVQARADDLQAQLERVTAEARAIREDAEQKEKTRNFMEAQTRARTARITELESNLRAARFELQCAQADVSAKEQLFRTNLELNSRLRMTQSDLARTQSALTTRDQQPVLNAELENRIESLQSQLQSTREETLTKDEEILRHVRSQEQLEQGLNTAQGRIEGLEAAITTLRQQLAEAHRDSARSRANSERLERDLEDTNERLQDAQVGADRRVAEVEQKLHRMKESKLEAEHKFRELQAQRDDLIEGHEAMLEDVRDKAEDAVRKAGALLEQARGEKQRIVKDLKKTKDELEKSRAEAAQRLTEEEESDDSETSMSASTTKEKDTEIKSLRDIIRKQVSEIKTLKIETSILRKENKKLNSNAEFQFDLEANISDLKDEISTLRKENATLQANLEDQEAVNIAMDEKLATLLSKLMKERAKTVVGKRDGQWQESVGQVQNEKELLGKVLLRQWGREELGVADEKHGEKQTYQYKYAKRERA
jgi:chromosome segregation ATPase